MSGRVANRQDAKAAKTASVFLGVRGVLAVTRWWVGAAAALFVALVGPWPVRDGVFEDAGYYRASIKAIRGAPVPSGPARPLRGGVGAAAIPLAEAATGGWPRQHLFATRAAGTGGESLQVRALALADGARTLYLVTADLLLITPAVAQATLDALAKGGVPADRVWVYFGASHTHSGPGGLGSGLIEQVMLGRYRRDFADLAGTRMAAAIQQARRGLVPVEIGSASIPVPEPLGNRLVAGAATDPHLDILAVRESGGRPLAVALAYAAHPTTLGGEDRGFSGDYPGALARRLEERTGARTLFFAGAVGSTTVVREDLRGPGGPERLGALLADAAAAALPRIAYRPEARLAALRVPVALPAPQVRLTGWLALSPVLPWLLLPREAALHVAAVNDVALVGVPGEFSGEEALWLRAAWSARGVRTMPTSLNGEYIGYILPDARYGTGDYEARWGAMYGPRLGGYFRALIGEALARVAPPLTQ